MFRDCVLSNDYIPISSETFIRVEKRYSIIMTINLGNEVQILSKYLFSFIYSITMATRVNQKINAIVIIHESKCKGV